MSETLEANEANTSKEVELLKDDAGKDDKTEYVVFENQVFVEKKVNFVLLVFVSCYSI